MAKKAGGDLVKLIHLTAKADYQFYWISHYQIHVGWHTKKWTQATIINKNRWRRERKKKNIRGKIRSNSI